MSKKAMRPRFGALRVLEEDNKAVCGALLVNDQVVALRGKEGPLNINTRDQQYNQFYKEDNSKFGACREQAQRTNSTIKKLSFTVPPSSLHESHEVKWTFSVLKDGNLQVFVDDGLNVEKSQLALDKGLQDMNDKFQQLTVALARSKEALAQAETTGEVSDIGALYLEQKRLNQEIQKMDQATKITFTSIRSQSSLILEPGKHVYLERLSSVLCWCPVAVMTAQDTQVEKEVQLQKSDQNLVTIWN